LGFVATMFIAAQLALILRWPLPSYVPWIVVAAVGAGTVLSYAILAEYFPKELAGRANAALNVFHIAGAFVVQYMTGLLVQLWAPTNGHYPEIAYQTAFAFNVGLQIIAGVWFALTWILTRRGELNEFDAFSLKPLHAFELWLGGIFCRIARARDKRRRRRKSEPHKRSGCLCTTCQETTGMLGPMRLRHDGAA
jgi:MFS family permease